MPSSPLGHICASETFGQLPPTPVEDLALQAVDYVLGLRGSAVYLAVGFFTWSEAAFFLGLVTPGELAMVVGGVLAHRGQVGLGGVAAAAAAGTVLGNVTGYWLGRGWGARVLSLGPVRRLAGGSMESARDFFRRRGEWAIVLGKLVSYVRVFVPFLAGASGLSFRRFLVYDFPSGVAWSVAWVLAGLALGESWRVLQEVAGPAAFLVLVLFLVALAIRWAAVRVARRRERVEAAARWLLARTPFRWLRGVAGGLGRWLRARFDPRLARGLNFTLGFLVVLVGAGAVGVVLNQVEHVRGIARLDFPVLEWMAATRTDAAVDVARTVLGPFRAPGFLIPALLLTAWIWWRRDWRPAVRTVLGVLGSGVGAELLDQHVLHGVVPRAGFPSVPVAVAAALLVHGTAWVGTRHAWGATVAAAAVGVFLACTVALATLVAGWAAPSGIVLGFGLGLVWSTSVELSARLRPGPGDERLGAISGGQGAREGRRDVRRPPESGSSGDV